jgi:DNA-binding FrmR family transcriptional regulator
VKPEHKRSAVLRLKTVRGHIDGILAMVEREAYCPTVMKQVSAAQGALEKVNRVLLQNHLETCVPHAIASGRAEAIVAELMETLRYTGALTGPGPGGEPSVDSPANEESEP